MFQKEIFCFHGNVYKLFFCHKSPLARAAGCDGCGVCFCGKKPACVPRIQACVARGRGQPVSTAKRSGFRCQRAKRRDAFSPASHAGAQTTVAAGLSCPVLHTTPVHNPLGRNKLRPYGGDAACRGRRRKAKAPHPQQSSVFRRCPRRCIRNRPGVAVLAAAKGKRVGLLPLWVAGETQHEGVGH